MIKCTNFTRDPSTVKTRLLAMDFREPYFFQKKQSSFSLDYYEKHDYWQKKLGTDFYNNLSII